MKKLSFFLVLLLVASINSQAQTGKKGWDAFLQNDNAKARAYFNQEINDPTLKSESLLGMFLLNNQENKADACFESFKQFYQSSANPYPYLYALSSFPPIHRINENNSLDKLAFFEKIVAEPSMNGTLKAVISERIGQYYEANNQPKKANEWYNKMGNIDCWQVLGTFDNISSSGFGKDWGAVTKAKPDDVFKNKVDADVKWYTPPFNKPNNWFAFDYYFIFDNTIMYAQSFVNSPSNQQVYVRVGTSGSLKVWVNDALVISVPEERNCDLDIYSCQVNLNKGANRILVQIGQSEIDAANFMLRLTDENANAISGLSCSNEYAPYVKATDSPSLELLPFFAEEYFLKKIDSEPSNPINYIFLANTYLRNDKAYEATKILKTLDTMAPNSVVVSELLAEAFLRSKNLTDYNKENEKIKQIAPNSYTALSESFDEAIKSEKYAEAGLICKKAKELYGESTITEDWDLLVASYEKRNADVLTMVAQLSAKYPKKYDYMYYSYGVKKTSSKNGKGSTEIVEGFCKTNNNETALELLSNIYFEEGKYDKALEVLNMRLEKSPYAIGYMSDILTKLFKMQRYNEALLMSDKMLALSPYLSSTFNWRGYIYKNLNEVEKAKENFKKAIYYNPTSYDSRTQLRQLENKQELNALFTKTYLDSLISKAPIDKDYPQDNAVILLNDERLIVYPEGAKESKNEIAIKILNQAGVGVWKDYSIDYNSNIQKLIIDKAEIIKANGTKAKAETDNDNNVVFTNLEVNDVIHLDYRIEDYSTSKIAKNFSSSFALKYSMPSVVNRFSLLVPKDKSFNYVLIHGDLKPKVRDIEDLKLYEWEMTHQAGINPEPLMSELADIVPTLYFSSIPDWKFVSTWYKDVTSSKLKSDYVLKETVAFILKGKENASQLEKAKLFYNYIMENITYSNISFMQGNYIPQKASRTITTRLGDCKDVSTLFVTLCREVGINANLVLISTRNNGNMTMPLPSINFNHCIAQLNIDDKKYYLELTNNTLPFGSAITYDLNSEILPIPYADEAFGDKIISMDMPFRKKNCVDRINTISINENDIRIQRKSVYVCTPTYSLRDSYRYIGEEQQLKDLSESVASDFTVPVKITNLKYTNLDNLEDSLSISYNIDVKGALQDVASMKILKLPWTDKFTSLEIVNLEKRLYPMEIWDFWREDFETEKITLVLPANKKFVDLPTDVNLECANALYRLTFKAEANGSITINRYFSRKSEQVSPEQYTAFRDFLHKVSEYDNKQYAIQ